MRLYLIYDMSRKKYYTGSRRSTRVYKFEPSAEERVELLNRTTVHVYEVHTFGRVT